MDIEQERYLRLRHSHGEPYAAFDRAFNSAYRITKDVEYASLKALAAFVSTKDKSEAQNCSPSQMQAASQHSLGAEPLFKGRK